VSFVITHHLVRVEHTNMIVASDILNVYITHVNNTCVRIVYLRVLS